MTKVLVIQGGGMNMRGKTQLDIFGPTTLEQMNEQIRGFAEGLGIKLVNLKDFGLRELHDLCESIRALA